MSRRRFHLSTTCSFSRSPQKHKRNMSQHRLLSPFQAAHSYPAAHDHETATSEQIAQWRSWQDGIAHRYRLRGGGASGGLLQALQTLMQNTQEHSEDEMDFWLRGELQHLLTSSNGGKALMHGMRKILLQAETWNVDSAKHKTHARWNAAKSSQTQHRQRWVQHSKVAQAKINHNRWNKSKKFHHNVVEEWQAVRWRPRLQEFGPSEKVKLFICNHELSNFLDQSDCTDWNIVLHADDMDQKFCTNWQHIVKKPCEAARAWCVHQHAAILDAWNFQLSDNTVVKGLIRVKSPEIAQALFQQRGFEHQGVRWFVEILQPDATPQAVQWFPWDGEEDWNAYGTRCRQAAGQKGLVRGRKQLGVKISANEAIAAPTKWIIEHFPKHIWMIFMIFSYSIPSKKLRSLKRPVERTAPPGHSKAHVKTGKN